VSRPLIGLAARAFTTVPEEAIRPIVELLADPPSRPLSAFTRRRRLPLAADERDQAEADRLHAETQRLLASILPSQA